MSRGLLSSKIGPSLRSAKLRNFSASESGHFVGATQRVVEDRFLSSYSFFFTACILQAGFPTVGLSSKFGLQRGVVLSQGNISIHGLDLWYRLRHFMSHY